MKFLKRKIISVFVIALLIFIGSNIYGQNSEKEDSAYNNLIEYSKSIQSVEGDFIEIKELNLLSEKITRKGMLYFIAPSKFRWEYDSNNYGVTNNGKGYMIINGINNTLASKAFEQIGKIVSSFITGSQVDSKEYDLIYFLKNDSLIIELTPKSKRVKMMIDKISVSFNTKTNSIEWYQMERKKDITKVEFENLKYNTKVDPQLFN